MKIPNYGLAILALFTTMQCPAALRTEDPAVVCSILRDTQLLAGNWTPAAGNESRCESPGRVVRDDDGQTSEIIYMAQGSANHVQQASLIIKLKDRSAMEAAERELLRATNRLSVRLLGLSIPAEIRDALKKFVPANASVGSGTIRVYREQVKGGRGISIFVLME